MMWCTNDVSFIFVVEWGVGVSDEKGWEGFEMGVKIEEKNLARKRCNENGPKIEASTIPSSGKQRSLELCHTSGQFGWPHQGLGKSGVWWEHPPGCDPKDLGD